MAALVGLEKAKAHLRVTATDSDDDIQLKVEQASAIILDYLKGRANNPITVTSSSVASPTVITLASAHTFVNGNTVVITGHADSTPAIAGSYVISGATALTFTIPVAVTVAGTGGTAYVAWDETTVPGQVQAATLLLLARLYEQRGDDEKADADCWLAIERLLMRSRDPAFA